MKPAKLNFCESIRNAIVAMGLSTEMIRNVVNCELGKMKLKTEAEESTGDMSIKTPKKKAWSATVSVKLGTEKYETKSVNEAIMFNGFNDGIAKLEKFTGAIDISLEKHPLFSEWLVRVGTPKVTTPTPAPEQTVTTP